MKIPFQHAIPLSLLYTHQIETIYKKKKCKKAKQLAEEALKIVEKEKKWETKRKRKDISISLRMQCSKEEQGEIKKKKNTFFSDQCKERGKQ